MIIIVITIILRRVEYAVYLSKILLIFNLLPIIPLDGGRILNILLTLITPYKKSLSLIIKVSYIVYILLLFFIIKLSSIFFVLVTIFLIFKINEEKKNINLYFNKFLLERYLYNFKYKKSCIVKALEDMYKYKNNIIKLDKRIYNEREYIGIILNKKNCKKV